MDGWKNEDGRRKMEDGRWKMEEGRRKMEEGRWKMEEGRRKMEDGRWKKEEGRWKMEEGRWKKEGSFLKLAMPNAFGSNYQFPLINNQFPKQIGRAPHALSIRNYSTIIS
jgi:hypothetical protein